MSDNNPLLNNVSVQGAAKTLEGLLDPKTATIKAQDKEAPVEPKEEVEAKVETAPILEAEEDNSTKEEPKKDAPKAEIVAEKKLENTPEKK